MSGFFFVSPKIDEEIDGPGFLELSEDDIKMITSKMGLIKKLQRLIREVSVVNPLLFPCRKMLFEHVFNRICINAACACIRHVCIFA